MSASEGNRRVAPDTRPVDSRSDPPLPPEELMSWVGQRRDTFEVGGRTVGDFLLGLLPDRWWLDARRVLDFGCGPGRVLRHLLAEAEKHEFHGCDIHGPSVEWVRENLCPPIAEAFVNGERPPLPKPDGHYDLVYANSVFTHLTEQWSNWILELHRVLTSSGFLVVTFLGRPFIERLPPVASDEDRTGMNVLHIGNTWESGGPIVLHSRWWIEAHWGRAFDVLSIEDEPMEPGGHGVAVMRRKAVTLTVEDLEREEPGEPREFAARRQQLLQTRAEEQRLYEELSRTQEEMERMRDTMASQQRERDRE